MRIGLCTQNRPSVEERLSGEIIGVTIGPSKQSVDRIAEPYVAVRVDRYRRDTGQFRRQRNGLRLAIYQPDNSGSSPGPQPALLIGSDRRHFAALQM